MVSNVLSVDLESFVHREFDISKREADNGLTVKATRYLLDIFDLHKTKTTFFVVGQIYDWYPQLIEEIKERGHELAYHSHNHIEIDSKETLLKELKLSKKFLDKYKPFGFRAPRIYFKEEFFPILQSFGFKYDSSTYGIFQSKSYSGIKEIPVSIFPYRKTSAGNNSFAQKFIPTLLTRGIPYGSGLSLSLLQKNVKYFIKHSNSANIPSILFFHPWQLIDYKQGFSPRYLVYRKRIDKTLGYLLSEGTFVPMKTFLNL